MKQKSKTKRVLTKNEEQAIRECHHDHGGKSIKETAKCMGRSVRAVQRLLCSASKKAPQMFPILTPQHRAILSMYDKRMSRKTIMAMLGITIKVLRSKIEFLRKHGFLHNQTMDQFQSWMDEQIKEKF